MRYSVVCGSARGGPGTCRTRLQVVWHLTRHLLFSTSNELTTNLCLCCCLPPLSSLPPPGAPNTIPLSSHKLNVGVGGSGIYALGFSWPTTIVPVAMDSLNSAKSSGHGYDYTVVMVGINDLLREGKSADDVMSGLRQIYDAALSSGSNVIAIPPFAAPGFVSK